MSHDASSVPQREGAAPVGRAFGVSRRRLAAGVLLILLVVMLAVHGFVAETFTVPSGSMEPTFVPGDRIVVNKLAHTPERGQVVVFSGDGSLDQHADAHGVRGVVDRVVGWLGFRPDEQDYLKRVIAVGGDHVRVRAGRLEINGHRVDEPYLGPGLTASNDPFDVTVPRGTVFVMGDNRPRSNDSRNHLGDPGGGFVPDDKIIGAVSWTYWHG